MSTALALPKNPTHAQIKALERQIATLPPVEAPITHHFAHGVYGREMFLPAGSVISGKMHRYSTLNVLVAGTIHVTTPDGVRELTAPAIFTSPPMTKKVGFAVTDVRWLNVHPTRLTDVAAIEQKFIVAEPPLSLEGAHPARLEKENEA
jgi:hypothetical protein